MKVECPDHRRPLVYDGTTETLAYEWGREVYRRASVLICPERGCPVYRVEGSR